MRMPEWFKARCPVPEEPRQWVDRRIAWASTAFGTERIRDCPVILPTQEFFPDPYHADDDSAERIFSRVCSYLNLDRARVTLRMVAGRHDDPGGALFIQSEGGAAGTYQAARAGRKEVIAIDRCHLRNPMVLVATMAHELCHVHLLGDNRISSKEEDHEPLTDLLTVCLGMGIFGANASVQYGTWSDAGHYGWHASKLGYLPQDTWGYALAAFAKMRGEHKPAWAKHVRADVRATLMQGIKYLARSDP
jgi:hypothetical protein